MNIKHIAATLAILGSASFTLTGCKKGTEGTETPAADGEKKAEGSCGAAKDGSCSGAKKEGEGEAAPADGAAAPAEGG